MIPHFHLALSCILLAVLSPPATAFSNHALFHSFYPALRFKIEAELKRNCSTEYTTYMTGSSAGYTVNGTFEPNSPAAYVDQLMLCILGTFSQYELLDMQSADVLLGFLPTTLALAGTTTTEIGLLSLRRPVLALLLSAGAPAAAPVRTFEYRDPGRTLRIARRTGRRVDARSSSAARLTPSRRTLVLVAEYCLAIAAVANVVVACYLLGTRTICSWALNISFLPGTWAALTLLIHTVGCIAPSRIVRLETSPVDGSHTLGWRNHKKVEANESGNEREDEHENEDGSQWFAALTWAVATGNILHIIAGTLVFSSLLFISARDAVLVVLQFLVSTVVCRAILMYELGGLRASASLRKGADESDRS